MTAQVKSYKKKESSIDMISIIFIISFIFSDHYFPILGPDTGSATVLVLGELEECDFF